MHDGSVNDGSLPCRRLHWTAIPHTDEGIVIVIHGLNVPYHLWHAAAGIEHLSPGKGKKE